MMILMYIISVLKAVQLEQGLKLSSFCTITDIFSSIKGYPLTIRFKTLFLSKLE